MSANSTIAEKLQDILKLAPEASSVFLNATIKPEFVSEGMEVISSDIDPPIDHKIVWLRTIRLCNAIKAWNIFDTLSCLVVDESASQ